MCGVSEEKVNESKNKKKVVEADIIVKGTKEKPYYEIKYLEVGKNEHNLGYGSYNLDFVFQWLEEDFEIERQSEEKIVQFPVDMDELQRNILISLLNARKECVEQNLLTVHGMVAIIDALFYLVKEKPIIPAFVGHDDVGNVGRDFMSNIDKNE